MNCKPGQLAMVVRNSFNLECFDALIGTPVETVRAVRLMFDDPAWVLKRPLKCPACGETYRGAYDADLQPMRPPGEIEKVKTDTPASARSTEFARN